ncbi:hypothetical protein ACIHDR_23850 [Nocardia sp. NPDC052278]|uniref:hypothetical protein n=1 Tax=unclassified Nocardia TaxID=2637762 RepID=UPI00369C5CF4
MKVAAAEGVWIAACSIGPYRFGASTVACTAELERLVRDGQALENIDLGGCSGYQFIRRVAGGRAGADDGDAQSATASVFGQQLRQRQILWVLAIGSKSSVVDAEHA